MNTTEVMVEVTEAASQSAMKKSYAAPTGPQDLSVRATKSGGAVYTDAGALPSTS